MNNLYGNPMNTLNNDFDLRLENKINVFHNRKFGEISYDGYILGSVRSNKDFSCEETINTLSKVEHIEKFIDVVNSLVGNARFYFKIKDKFFIIFSPNSYPYFFYKIKDELFFSFVESEICGLAAKNGEKINPIELFDLLKLHRKELTPYGSLFNNVIKIPYGHLLKIDKKLKLSYKSYFNERTKRINHSYKNFKRVLELTAKLYSESEYKLYLLLGGIDSLVIYLAVKNSTKNIIPISYCQEGFGSDDGGNVRETTRVYEDSFDINVNLIHADRYSPKLRKIRDDICKLNSSSCAVWDSYVFYSVMDKYPSCDNSCIFLTGHPFDSVYGITFTKNLFGDVKGIIGRYFYSKMYQNRLNGLINSKIRKLYKNNSKMNPKKEYVYAQYNPSQYINHSLPIIKNHKVCENDQFNKKYLKYKEEKYIKSAVPDLASIKNFNGYDLNRTFRILRHYQSGLLHTRNNAARDYYSGYYTSTFPGEGPLFDFFSDFQFGWKDIFFGKRYLHKYFREKTGKSYTKIFLQSNTSPKLDFPKKFIKSLGKYDFSDIKTTNKDGRFVLRNMNGAKDKFLFSTVIREDFFKKVDLDKPTPLSFLENKYLVKFVKEYYEDAKKGLLDFNEIMDIYNLEIFLKNLYE